VTEKLNDPDEARRQSERGILYDGKIYPWQCKPIVQATLDKQAKVIETWIYDAQSKEERKVTAEEAKRYRPGRTGPNDSASLQGKVSPDGSWLVDRGYVSDVMKSPHERYSLFIRPLSGGEPIDLTPGAFFVFDFWWSADGNEVYFVEYSADLRPPKLCAVPVGGGTARKVLQFDDLVSQFSEDRGATLAACVRENSTSPESVAVMDLKSGALRTLVNVNPEFQNIQLSPASRIEWKDKYGETGFGYLVKPLKYQPGEAYPLIVTTYRAGGFLRGGVGDEYPIQVFAANGFAVLAFEMGTSFTNFRSGDFHGAMRHLYPIASLEAALRVLEGMGIADRHRRGLTGLSYGAGMVELTISHADLFQVAIDSGPADRDPFNYYMAGEGAEEKYAHWGLGGWPENKEVSTRWHELSPALNADHIKAPLLVNTADSEFIGGLQLYTSLKSLQKPLEVFIYAGEGHIKNQPKHRLEIYQRNLDWFRFWLKNEEDPDRVKAEQYTRWRELRKLQEKNEKVPAEPDSQ